jgi:uncharacterized protein with PhoU and TrkA domain
VLAVHRAGRWTYRPRRSFVLRTDDRLLAIGPEEGAPRLREFSGDDRPEGDEGWVETPGEDDD